MTVFFLLKSFPNFDHFLTYYQIPIDNMRAALYHMDIKSYTKGETIFHLGDESEIFYIIFKGSVVIREQTMTKSGKYYFRDKLILKEGSCFGEFGLLYNQPRGQTILSLEDTNLLEMNSQHFNLLFYEHMHKTENGRKSTIMNLIPVFKKISKKNFIKFYKNFIFKKITKQNYIYKEGDDADSIFLIFSGRARLVKHNYNLIYITKNDLVGLEAIEITNGTPKYKSSLITIDDCIIIRIRINVLGNITEKFINCLKEMKKTKEKLIDKLLYQNEMKKGKFKVVYHENNIKNRINFLFKGCISSNRNYFDINSCSNNRFMVEDEKDEKRTFRDNVCKTESKKKVNIKKLITNFSKTMSKEPEGINKIKPIPKFPRKNMTSRSIYTNLCLLTPRERAITGSNSKRDEIKSPKSSRKANSVINIIQIKKDDERSHPKNYESFHYSKLRNKTNFSSTNKNLYTYQNKRVKMYDTGLFDLPLVVSLTQT